MQTVAERYGFEVNRSGDILCPFHSDSKPSLHVYPGTRGWWCFVCNEGGSVIDFVTKLFHLNARQAALRLDNDFGLGLSTQRPDRNTANEWMQQRQKEAAALATAQAEYTKKSIEVRDIRGAPKPPANSPLWGPYAQLLGRLDYLENCWFAEHKYPERYKDLQEMR